MESEQSLEEEDEVCCLRLDLDEVGLGETLGLVVALALAASPLDLALALAVPVVVALVPVGGSSEPMVANRSLNLASSSGVNSPGVLGYHLT